jgi:transcription antitermination protein NusB
LQRSRWWISSASWTRMRLETRARSRALQAIYAWDLRGEQDLDRVSRQIFDDLLVNPDERRIANVLLQTLQKERADLDRQLAEVTTNWRLGVSSGSA